MQVCVPVEKPGNYVVSVRHDLNGNGKSDRSDGGGLSGNPDMKVTDFIFNRKPKLTTVSFAVGCATKRVPVTLNYVSGLSFEPVKYGRDRWGMATVALLSTPRATGHRALFPRVRAYLAAPPHTSP